MNKLRIGLGQINTRTNVDENFKVINKIVSECSQQGAEMVIFPECSTYLSQKGAIENAQFLNGTIIDKFKSLAKEYNVYIHNGSYIEKDENSDKAFNTSVLINPKGEIEATYRKIHLYDVDMGENLVYKESNIFNRGDSIVNISNELGDFGMTICYDLRFPELFRKLTLNGAKLIFVPAAFTVHTGKDHWEALLKARAIENQIYIVAVGQIGERADKKVSFGNSMVIDPWGTVIAKASERVCSTVVDVDWDYLEHTRKILPSLNNRVDIDKLKTVK
ncbi:carbon-nitrogen hydrolase family protein [Clostridium grantii]|uniref:Predicted amidohydrolase n=1 Tax=Clostridium grantii DSM 8605 TaxID=1121316 RepID=A0A1M5WRU7_9CLOT|nr:carbon-nitrogen hydrolase family protein [Clostridium grantii]SHH89834.1 Predicted amidohydrolase [Clostridium grantii DSM 8605]